jgi:LysM repeat protein
MKTSCPASRALSSLIFFWGLAAVSPLPAQVSNTYTAPPPPGYPAAGSSRPTSSKSTRQSAAAVQAPATYPGYPSTYPPPPGYTYPPPPPGYGTSTRAPATKPSTSGKSSSKTPSSKKSTAGPPPPKVYGPTGDLSSQVSKLRESDKVQNLRLGELERDVSSIKRGGKSSVRYDGGSDIAARTTYVARPGDTLWRIASTHRVSVGEIQQLNRMTEEEVHVGQTLLIPSPHRLSSSTTQVSYTPATPGGSSAPVSSSSYYTIKKGDSLKAIAIKHKMTTAALASANGIKDANKIFVGQRLKIPGQSRSNVAASKPQSPPSESTDTIPLPGYGVPAATPPAAAGLAPAPQAPTAPAPAAPKAPSTTDSHRGILAYRVDLSDSIESIASQFSTTPDRIREMNRLSAGTPLKAGDEIMVPAMGAVSVSSR